MSPFSFRENCGSSGLSILEALVVLSSCSVLTLVALPILLIRNELWVPADVESLSKSEYQAKSDAAVFSAPAIDLPLPKPPTISDLKIDIGARYERSGNVESIEKLPLVPPSESTIPKPSP